MTDYGFEDDESYRRRKKARTVLLTDEAKLHGSHWLADIPLRAGSPTAKQLRSVQGVRAPITIGPLHANDAIVFLADVTGDVETWRVYKAAHTFRINDVVKVVRAYDSKLVGRQGRVILLRAQPEGVLVQFGTTEPDVWLAPDDVSHHAGGCSPLDAHAQDAPNAYRVGDTIEVVDRPDGHSYGPPVGHRATVVEVSDFSTLCIPWDGEGHDGFWLSYDQVRRVDEPEPAPEYQIGDTVDVSPSSAWTAGGRGTVVELDDDDDNFTPICVECEGLRWWVPAGCVKRVGTKPAPDLHVSPSIWSAPTIAPDGTKTFTAPGVTCVEHPPTAADGFPSWTITADAPSEPIVSDNMSFVDKAKSTINAWVIDKDNSADMKRIRVEFVCVPDDGESIVLEVDGLRTHPFGRRYDSLTQLRDEALTRLARIGVYAVPVEHFTIELVARSVVDQSNTSAACVRIELSTEDAVKLLTLAEKAR